jgi:nucleoside-diphosphate-sugar epimerase
MVLVTGGAGLVGKALITELLAGNKKLRVIFNKTPLPDFGYAAVEQFQCNILDVVGLEEAMKGVDEVYHCAAIVSFNPRRKMEMYKVNVEGTANIVNAALDAGVKKMVYVSSVAALGRIRENVVINETMNWTPETSNSAYGESKFLAEMEVWRGIGEGMPAVIVNPVIILGNGNWNDGSSKIFQSVYNEFPWYTDGVTGFVDVKDVAAVMIKLMDSSITAERFILSAENKTYGEVLKQMAIAFDKKPPHKKVTPLIAKIVWRLEAIKSLLTGKEPLITKETAKTALAKVSFDNSKLKRFLPDFTYRKIDITISETCNAYKIKNV